MLIKTPFGTYDKCYLVRNSYRDKTPYIGIWDPEGPFADLTVWIEARQDQSIDALGENLAFVDTNNFPQAMDFIREYRLGTPTGHYGRSGYCLYPLVRFDMSVVDKYTRPIDQDSTEKEKEEKAASPLNLYVHLGEQEFDPAQFTPVKNKPLCIKPSGGYWASAVNAPYGWIDFLNSQYASEDDDWNKELDPTDKPSVFEAPKASFFKISENARVLVIDSASAKQELPKQDIGSFPSLLGLSIANDAIDFEALSEEYDVIDFRFSDDENLYMEFYGWDCDSIVVMNPDVVQKISREQALKIYTEWETTEAELL